MSLNVINPPKSVQVVIDADNQIGEVAQVWSRPGASVLFVIQNNHGEDHTVWIDPREFIPSVRYGDGPPLPMEPDTQVVKIPGRDVAVIQLKVKGPDHFRFQETPWIAGYTYKYNIYWTDPDGTRHILDPDIEIRP